MQSFLFRTLIALSVASLSAACGSAPAGPGEAGEPDLSHVEVEDLEWAPDDDKADGANSTFTAGNLMSDAEFLDTTSLTADEIQAFLEDPPYRWTERSFLADQKIGDRRFADVLVEVAAAHGVNPLVFLVKLQVESSMVAKDAPLSAYRMSVAMGCGCADGQRCAQSQRGLGQQLTCAGEVFRTHFKRVNEKGSSISGWGTGIAKKTLDPVTVTPANTATAVLYTYTPWVLEGRGGNWLYWKVLAKYRDTFEKAGALDPARQPDPVQPPQANRAPSAPTLLGPADRAEVDENDLHLKYLPALDPDEDALRYQIQIVNRESGLLVYDITVDAPSDVELTDELSHRVPPGTLELNAVHGWWVRAKDAESSGAWSRTDFFIPRP